MKGERMDERRKLRKGWREGGMEKRKDGWI